MAATRDHGELQELFREVVTQMAGSLAAFANVIREGCPTASQHQEAFAIAHSLHGSGKLYGFPSISELGASLEKVTDALRENRLPAGPTVASLLDSCAEALHRLSADGEPKEPLETRIRDLAWECECVLHAARGGAAEPLPGNAAGQPA